MASAASLHPLLRRAAPNLTRHFFSCKQCPQQLSRQSHSKVPSPSRSTCKSIRTTPFLQAFRSQSTSASNSAHPVSSLWKLAGEQAAAATRSTGTRTRLLSDVSPAEKRRYYPKTTRSIVGWWLIGSAVSVYGIVVFGGLTRLTESGLSITEWRPVTGTLPPLSEAAWDLEFMKYRRSPEFQKLNPNMTLPEFKRIFWMEYTHRLWGRAVGLSFLLPTIYFAFRRRVSLPILRNLALINGLIVTQGVVGWWMVASGLKDDLFAQNAHPRVSQYRLATHLGLAFVTYSAMLWTGLAIFRERKLAIKELPNRAVKLLDRLSSPRLRIFRWSSAALAALVFTTALSGALVAGLDAGLIYNEFPYMGLGLTPPKSELFSTFYSRQTAEQGHTDLVWRNMLENPTLVQLDHRILATSTFVAVHALYGYARLSPTVRKGLTSGAHRMLLGCVGLVWVQATLGITTLLYLVPTSVAAMHQAGSLALLTGIIVLGSRVWTPARLRKLVDGRAISVANRLARRRAYASQRAAVEGHLKVPLVKGAA